MSHILIFEAGSTKTSIRSSESNKSKKEDLPGINPNRKETILPFREALRSFSLNEEDQIYFYGSGLADERNKQVIQKLFQEETGVIPVQIHDDLIGAGRALFGDGNGVFAIMGTGGIVAEFDRDEILNRKGGYGYLIDDLGGGLELGKCIVSSWLNNSFPEEIEQEIFEHLSADKKDFTTLFYHSKDLETLSRLSYVAHKYRKEEEMSQILSNYFNLFFERHILPLTKRSGKKTFGAIGSIAHNFREELSIVAQNNGLEIHPILQFPVEHLLRYHMDMDRKFR